MAADKQALQQQILAQIDRCAALAYGAGQHFAQHGKHAPSSIMAKADADATLVRLIEEYAGQCPVCHVEGGQHQRGCRNIAGVPAAPAPFTAEWLFANCRIVFFPPGNGYPVEHNPHAQGYDKDGSAFRRNVTAALGVGEVPRG